MGLPFLKAKGYTSRYLLQTPFVFAYGKNYNDHIIFVNFRNTGIEVFGIYGIPDIPGSNVKPCYISFLRVSAFMIEISFIFKQMLISKGHA